jgi:hypothetical protein
LGTITKDTFYLLIEGENKMMLEIGNLIAAARRRTFPNREAYLNVLNKLREKELKIKNNERSIELQKKWLNELKSETENTNELQVIEKFLSLI